MQLYKLHIRSNVWEHILNMNSLRISIQTLEVGQIGYNLWCILKETNSIAHANIIRLSLCHVMLMCSFVENVFQWKYIKYELLRICNQPSNNQDKWATTFDI